MLVEQAKQEGDKDLGAQRVLFALDKADGTLDNKIGVGAFGRYISPGVIAAGARLKPALPLAAQVDANYYKAVEQAKLPVSGTAQK